MDGEFRGELVAIINTQRVRLSADTGYPARRRTETGGVRPVPTARASRESSRPRRAVRARCATSAGVRLRHRRCRDTSRTRRRPHELGARSPGAIQRTAARTVRTRARDHLQGPTTTLEEDTPRGQRRRRARADIRPCRARTKARDRARNSQASQCPSHELQWVEPTRAPIRAREGGDAFVKYRDSADGADAPLRTWRIARGQRVSGDPILETPWPWAQDALLRFRSFSSQGSPCRH